MTKSGSVLCVVLLPLAFTATACEEVNPVYCEAHPDDAVCSVMRDTATVSCTSDSQCSNPTPVCDTTRQICVQCTPAEANACAGTTPTCSTSDVCQSCQQDTDCASQTCFPDGSCAAAVNVLYASVGGSNNTECTLTDKCTLTRAVALVDGTKYVIRLDPGLYGQDTLGLPDSVRIVGRGAQIERDASGDGATIAVGSIGGSGNHTATVELNFVAVAQGDGAGVGNGISCYNSTLITRGVVLGGNASSGINGTSCTISIGQSELIANLGYAVNVTGGSLDLHGSLISGNITGAVVVSGGQFDIENNYINDNGGTNAASAVTFSSISTAGTHVFAFNTVVYNQSQASVTPGVSCSAVLTPLLFENDIVYGNSNQIGSVQVAGSNCAWSYSDIGPVGVAGNISADPQFVSVPGNNFRIKATSPARDAADPAATQPIDWDGDSRPQGPRSDIGADEYKP